MYTEQNNACCAVEDIHNLADSASAESAMRDFVQEHISASGGYYSYYNRCTTPSELEVEIPGHVIFTEVVGFQTAAGKKRVRRAYEPKTNGYGKKFAAYIKRHKLGSVVASAVTKNHVNHPDHLVKVYVWTPDIKAVEALNKKKGWVTE